MKRLVLYRNESACHIFLFSVLNRGACLPKKSENRGNTYLVTLQSATYANFFTERKAGIETLTTYIVDTSISSGGGPSLWKKNAMDIASTIHENEVMNEIPFT